MSAKLQFNPYDENTVVPATYSQSTVKALSHSTTRLLVFHALPPTSVGSHNRTPARSKFHAPRPTMHILPNLNSTLHLRHHSHLIHAIVSLSPTTQRTVSQRRLGFFEQFLDRAFTGKERTVVETHAWRAGNGDGHPFMLAARGFEDLGTHMTTACAIV